jgi:hypothetical protein
MSNNNYVLMCFSAVGKSLKQGKYQISRTLICLCKDYGMNETSGFSSLAYVQVNLQQF